MQNWCVFCVYTLFNTWLVSNQLFYTMWMLTEKKKKNVEFNSILYHRWKEDSKIAMDLTEWIATGSDTTLNDFQWFLNDFILESMTKQQQQKKQRKNNFKINLGLLICDRLPVTRLCISINTMRWHEQTVSNNTWFNNDEWCKQIFYCTHFDFYIQWKIIVAFI